MYIGKDVVIDFQYYNKCVNCGGWSLHVPGVGQTQLPENITEEDLETILAQV